MRHSIITGLTTLRPISSILIVGHLVVPLALAVEIEYTLPYWLHAVLWIPLTLGLSLALLQPIKGAIVGLQWAFRMHGFNPRWPMRHVAVPAPCRSRADDRYRCGPPRANE